MADEVIRSMHSELPMSSDWTNVNMSNKILRTTAMASGRIFVGPELCRDEMYIETAINYTIDLMRASYVVTLVPPWLRTYVSPWLPPVRRLRRRVKQADNFLRPVVASRKRAALMPGHEAPNDMLHWLMNEGSRFGINDDEQLVKHQLDVSFAAIHTSTAITVNA
ncbi:hypothetical protein JDV02_006137 [Purpureocillium takamizusanense]|uniref:Uncharacterized protein n=1 Tax=Purpureocillium takamizusanense TaxID=2060973 RepID=A0A9Q8VB10_9HYPO|nr:uncharacterized protein JDV02_006137 [Purpureocillium takamizusanense]UNI20000.1 hypothetical protein JDV02_006137 [Purpureocillium takamizusanense]